ncbi:MAG: hypothetical protein ACLFU8_12925 [Anaerolineales bacterium]
MPEAEIEVVGIYPVLEHKGVSMVELIVDAPYREIDVGAFHQPQPGEPPEAWPVAEDVRYLNPEGTLMIGDTFQRPLEEHEKTRLLFFMHDLDIELPLRTPFGPLDLPKRRPMPSRLRTTIQYHPTL